MSDSNKTKLSPLEHFLAILGALLVGVGWLAAFADGTVIHPVLANRGLAWTIMVVGLILSAGLSMRLVLRVQKHKSAGRSRSKLQK